MFNINWYGMLKIEYDNGWMPYENLKFFVGNLNNMLLLCELSEFPLITYCPET